MHADNGPGRRRERRPIRRRAGAAGRARERRRSRARWCAGSSTASAGARRAAPTSRSPSPRPAPTRCCTPIPTPAGEYEVLAWAAPDRLVRGGARPRPGHHADASPRRRPASAWACPLILAIGDEVAFTHEDGVTEVRMTFSPGSRRDGLRVSAAYAGRLRVRRADLGEPVLERVVMALAARVDLSAGPPRRRPARDRGPGATPPLRRSAGRRPGRRARRRRRGASTCRSGPSPPATAAQIVADSAVPGRRRGAGPPGGRLGRRAAGHGRRGPAPDDRRRARRPSPDRARRGSASSPSGSWRRWRCSCAASARARRRPAPRGAPAAPARRPPAAPAPGGAARPRRRLRARLAERDDAVIAAVRAGLALRHHRHRGDARLLRVPRDPGDRPRSRSAPSASSAGPARPRTWSTALDEGVVPDDAVSLIRRHAHARDRRPASRARASRVVGLVLAAVDRRAAPCRR